MRKVALGLAALAAVAYSGSAMAVTAHDTVTVNINVDPIVSLWVSAANVNLTLNGSGPNNAAAANGSIYILNNVPAAVSVNVAGTLDPAIYFFLFGNDSDPASVVVAGINSINGLPNPTWGTNAYAPTGALVWSPANVAGAGTTQPLASYATDNLSALTYPIVYAADNPGPLADTTATPWSLTVTYTITSL